MNFSVPKTLTFSLSLEPSPLSFCLFFSFSLSFSSLKTLYSSLHSPPPTPSPLMRIKVTNITRNSPRPHVQLVLKLRNEKRKEFTTEGAVSVMLEKYKQTQQQQRYIHKPRGHVHKKFPLTPLFLRFPVLHLIYLTCSGIAFS